MSTVGTYQHNCRHRCCTRELCCNRSGCTKVSRSAGCTPDSSLGKLEHTHKHSFTVVIIGSCYNDNHNITAVPGTPAGIDVYVKRYNVTWAGQAITIILSRMRTILKKVFGNFTVCSLLADCDNDSSYCSINNHSWHAMLRCKRCEIGYFQHSEKVTRTCTIRK